MVKHEETEVAKIIFKDKLGNETDLQKMYFKDTLVFLKKFNLTKTEFNTSLFVERLSSEMGDVQIGSIEAGLNLYYGDKIKITATPNRFYNLIILEVNGKSCSNGSIHTVDNDMKINAQSYLPTCNKCSMNNSVCKGCTTGFGPIINSQFMLSNTDFMAIEDPKDEEI